MEPMVVICPGNPDRMSLVENYFNSDLYTRDDDFENEVIAHATREGFVIYKSTRCKVHGLFSENGPDMLADF